MIYVLFLVWKFVALFEQSFNVKYIVLFLDIFLHLLFSVHEYHRAVLKNYGGKA